MENFLVAVVAGGDSSEREISLLGAEHINSVLDKTKYHSYILDLSKNGWKVTLDEKGAYADVDKNDFSFTLDGKKHKFDYALINIHGTPGENGILQSYFELVSVPYSTCGVAASAASFDKLLTKRACKETGVALAKDYVIDRGDDIDTKVITEKLSLPLFVKPNASGSSFGVTKVKHENELIPAINEAFKEDSRVLIEEAITGTEISCGVMILNGKITLFPATEIVSKSEFFDYKAKYEGNSEEITPARISDKVRAELDTILVKIYKQMNMRGLIRIDFIVKNETPYLIEINTVPGMSKHSIIPQQAQKMGITMKELFTEIIENTK